MKILRLIAGFLGMAVLVTSMKSLKKDYTQVDKLRETVLLLDSDEDYPRSRGPATNKSQRDPSTYTELVKLYSELGDKIDRQFSENLEPHLHVLDSLWIWARMQSELRSIDGLYMTFRSMQEALIGKREPLNAKEWANFAKTILNDANVSIPKALERIADFIINEKLFNLASKVLYVHLAITLFFFKYFLQVLTDHKDLFITSGYWK